MTRTILGTYMVNAVITFATPSGNITANCVASTVTAKDGTTGVGADYGLAEPGGIAAAGGFARPVCRAGGGGVAAGMASVAGVDCTGTKQTASG